jgi:hypothetical protein
MYRRSAPKAAVCSAGAPLLAFAAVMLAPAPVHAGQSTPDNPVAAQSLERLSATRERPLFSPTRRPPAPPPAPVAISRPAPVPPPPPNVALFGIVTDAQGPFAMVRIGAGKILRLRPGDDVAGWRVGAIEPRRLTLSNGARSASFDLFGPSAGRGAAVQRAAAPARERSRPAAPDLPDAVPDRNGRYSRDPGPVAPDSAGEAARAEPVGCHPTVIGITDRHGWSSLCHEVVICAQ